MLVKAYNSIGKVERYYTLLRRAYKIICNKLANKKVNKEVILQIVVKAVNDLARPNSIVPTLLVFKAYPRITSKSTPSPSVIKRAKAIRVAIKEVRCIYTKQQITNVLNIRNGLNT